MCLLAICLLVVLISCAVCGVVSPRVQSAGGQMANQPAGRDHRLDQEEAQYQSCWRFWLRRRKIGSKCQQPGDAWRFVLSDVVVVMAVDTVLSFCTSCCLLLVGKSQVHSFDLVARNDTVTACDIAHVDRKSTSLNS